MMPMMGKTTNMTSYCARGAVSYAGQAIGNFAVGSPKLEAQTTGMHASSHMHARLIACEQGCVSTNGFAYD